MDPPFAGPSDAAALADPWVPASSPHCVVADCVLLLLGFFFVFALLREAAVLLHPAMLYCQRGRERNSMQYDYKNCEICKKCYKKRYVSSSVSVTRLGCSPPPRCVVSVTCRG